jgi:hypothetical protein
MERGSSDLYRCCGNGRVSQGDAERPGPPGLPDLLLLPP